MDDEFFIGFLVFDLDFEYLEFCFFCVDFFFDVLEFFINGKNFFCFFFVVEFNVCIYFCNLMGFYFLKYVFI